MDASLGMAITLTGISHHATPLALRERLSIHPGKLADAFSQLKKISPQAVILSTCNRTEIVATDACPNALLHWWANFCNLDVTTLQTHAYIHHDDQAVRHMMQVASGMNSMVLGEPQILGQVKQALHHAQLNGTIGHELDMACRHILSAAKAVRHETALGYCPVSVAFSAVKLAGQRSQDISKEKILLVGAGDTVKLLAQHLNSAEAKQISIINRDSNKAKALANTIGATVYPWENMADAIAKHSFVISATNAPKPIILPEHIGNSACTLIDLAVPRDIHPDINTLPNAQVHSLDDIQRVINHNTTQRTQAAIEAQTIVEKHLQNYQNNCCCRQAASTISALRQHTKIISDRLLDDSIKRLQAGDDPAEVLNHFAHSLTNKWLHQPSVELKTASINGEDQLLSSAKKLFGITQH